MKVTKILSLQKKASKEAQKVSKEAQKAINKIFDSYIKEVNELIAQEIPKGQTLLNGNGMCLLIDNKTNKTITSGRTWGITEGEDKALNLLSSLQYGIDFNINSGFLIKSKIKGKK